MVIQPFPHLILSFFTSERLRSLPWLGDIAAFLLLLSSVAIILGSDYQIASLFAEGTILISWIDDPEDLQDVLRSAIDCGDQRIIKLVLSKALRDRQTREKHAHYLIEHRDLLTTDWQLC